MKLNHINIPELLTIKHMLKKKKKINFSLG